MKHFLLCMSAFLVLSSNAFAQLSSPPSGNNQKSYVKQYIGAIAHVAVKYNSPDVTAPNGDDRKGQIWGQLVPWGMAQNNFGTASEIPWRAGANENTVIKFSHDMKVQGKDIAAGVYGFHIIPNQNGPWTLIFSHDNSAWGSYYYDKANDALRVTTTPKPCEYTEWLTYEFVDRQPNKATLALKWEELMIPMEIEVSNPEELYINTMAAELKGSAGFQWNNLNNAANYCLQNNIELEQGLEWAEAAVSGPFVGQANFTTLSTKAGLLSALGKTDEAEKTMDMAINDPSATAFQIHAYGRQLIAQGNPEKAMEIFNHNYEKMDGAWPVHVGMARGYSALGEYEKAIKHAKLALEQAPDDLNRNSLTSAIEKLKNGEDIN